MDVARIFLVARRTDGAETLLRDDLGEAEDRIERGAQLVVHICEEGCLRRIRRFGLEPLAQGFVACLFQLAREIFDLEAQPGVLIDAAHQPVSVGIKLDGGERSRTAMP